MIRVTNKKIISIVVRYAKRFDVEESSMGLTDYSTSRYVKSLIGMIFEFPTNVVMKTFPY